MAAKLATKPAQLRRGKRKLPPKALALIVIALGLSIALAIALALNLFRMRENFASVQHTNEVSRQLSMTEKALLEAESAERGYLLTGEQSYLENYNRARTDIPKLISALRSVTFDNPVQTKRVDGLRGNVDARLDELKRAIEFGPIHLADALAVLATAFSAANSGDRKGNRGDQAS